MREVGGRKKRLVLLEVILVIMGVCSLVYYGVILSILGFRKDFSLFWPALAVCSFAGFALILKIQKYKLEELLQVVNYVLGFLLIFAMLFALIEGLIIKTGYEQPAEGADYVIVLGAQVNGTKVSKALRYRLDAAYSYALENEDTKVIVSGGQGEGEDVSEAQAMHDYLVDKGLDETRILMEEESTNTKENIEFSKHFLHPDDYVVIVTNRFHLYRGTQIARNQLAAKVEGLGAETGTALFINYYVREAFAIVKDILVGNI